MDSQRRKPQKKQTNSSTHLDEKPAAPDNLPKSAHFQPRDDRNGYTNDARGNITAVIAQVIEAIQYDDVNRFQRIIQRHAFLMYYYPLAGNGTETALTLAAKFNSFNIANFLLAKGIDREFVPPNGKKALEHVSPHNQQIKKLLENDPTPILQMIKNLKKEFDTQKQKHQENELFFQIHLLAQAQLSKASTAIEAHSPDKLLDLYATVTSVYQILSAAKDEKELADRITDMLAIRERLFRGDAHDYCFMLSRANEFCCKLVEIVFPDASPSNLLLKNTLTQNRKNPWTNTFTGETDLLDTPLGYFRTSLDEIHIYEGIVRRAISNLQNAYTQQKEIWFGNDPKYGSGSGKDEVSEKSQLFFSHEVKTILRQRSPTLAQLIDYTIRLEENTGSNAIGLVERLNHLRTALKEADVKHAGQELEAGDVGYAYIAKFSVWWNALADTPAGREKQDSIRAITIKTQESGDKKLGEILDIILDAGHGEERSAVRYCLFIKGNLLEEFLKVPAVIEQLHQIDGSINWTVSHEQLDTWQQNIFEELQSLPPHITHHNIMMDIALYVNPQLFISTSSLDLSAIEKLAHLLPVLKMLHEIKEPLLNPADSAPVLEQIFNVDHLDLLLYLYSQSLTSDLIPRNATLFLAIALQLQQFCEKQHLTASDLQNKLPTYTGFQPLYLSKNNGKSHLDQLLVYAINKNLSDITRQLLDLGADQGSVEIDSQQPAKPLTAGTVLDVKDIRDLWVKAVVLATNENAVYISYLGWLSNYDEWIKKDSPRLAPSGTTEATIGRYRDETSENKLKRPLPAHLLPAIGTEFDVQDTLNNWVKAVVLASNESSFYISYLGWSAQYDEWIKRDSPRLAPPGSHSAIAGNVLNQTIEDKLQRTLPESVTSKASMTSTSSSSTFVMPTNTLWDTAFKNRNPEITAYLDNASKGNLVHRGLLDINTEKDWRFLVVYFAKVSLDKLSLSFLQNLSDKIIADKKVKLFIDFLPQRLDLLDHLFNSALSANKNKTIRLLLKHGVKPKPIHADIALAKGNEALLSSWLEKNPDMTCSNEAIMTAARSTQWPIILCYAQHRSLEKTLLFDLFAEAANSSNAPIAEQLLAEEKMPDVSETIKTAAKKGDLLIVDAYLKFHNPSDALLCELYRATAKKSHDDAFFKYAKYPVPTAALAQDKTLQSQLQVFWDSVAEHATDQNKKSLFALPKRGFVDVNQPRFFQALENMDSKFVIAYLREINPDKFDVTFLKKLLGQAILFDKPDIVDVLLKKFKNKITSLDVLTLAFEHKSPTYITTILRQNTRLTSDKLLMQAADQKNWNCVNAYMNERATTISQASKNLINKAREEQRLIETDNTLKEEKIIISSRDEVFARFQSSILFGVSANNKQPPGLQAIKQFAKDLKNDKAIDGYSCARILCGYLLSTAKQARLEHSTKLSWWVKYSELDSILTVALKHFKKSLKEQEARIDLKNDDVVKDYETYLTYRNAQATRQFR